MGGTEIAELKPSVKKLTNLDFKMLGKRFQVKSPPVQTIDENTPVGDITVKIGMGTMNLKEFMI